MAYGSNYIRERDQGLEFIRAFCGQHGETPAAWIVCPLIAVYYAEPDDSWWEPTPLPRHKVVYERAAALGLRLARPGGLTSVYRGVGRALFLDVSRNHRLVLHPVIEAAERDQGAEASVVSVRPDRRRAAELEAEAIELTRQLLAAATAVGVRLPVAPQRLLRDVISASAHLAYAEAAISQHQPEVVVVASNHGKSTRALNWAARERGIPSVYIPHAPMITERLLWDLPFDQAALRGSSERDLYGEHVSTDRIAVVGDPSLSALEVTQVSSSDPLVIAPTPYDELLGKMARALLEAEVENVIIAPHPAQDLSQLGDYFPSAWEVSDVRAFELLRRGARGLIQHSSGLALEALLLGIPTIEMTFGREASNYPFIREPYVHRIGERTGELKEGLAAIERDLLPERRSELVDWARSWCVSGGGEVADDAWEVVSATAERGATGPIWDMWGADGVELA